MPSGGAARPQFYKFLGCTDHRVSLVSPANFYYIDLNASRLLHYILGFGGWDGGPSFVAGRNYYHENFRVLWLPYSINCFGFGFSLITYCHPEDVGSCMN